MISSGRPSSAEPGPEVPFQPQLAGDVPGPLERLAESLGHRRLVEPPVEIAAHEHDEAAAPSPHPTTAVTPRSGHRYATSDGTERRVAHHHSRDRDQQPAHEYHQRHRRIRQPRLERAAEKPGIERQRQHRDHRQLRPRARPVGPESVAGHGQHEQRKERQQNLAVVHPRRRRCPARPRRADPAFAASDTPSGLSTSPGQTTVSRARSRSAHADACRKYDSRPPLI